VFAVIIVRVKMYYWISVFGEQCCRGHIVSGVIMSRFIKIKGYLIFKVTIITDYNLLGGQCI
jgi:hypothetical protein